MRASAGLIALVFAISTLPAASHETHAGPTGWSYDPECCGGQDCERVDEARIKVWLTPQGYTVDGLFIEESRVRRSKDNDWHACFWPKGKLHCLYRPPQGS